MLGMGMGVGMGVGASPAPGEPTLALDFVNSNTLDPRITFTRASAASYTDSSGTLQTAAVDGPRFDYDPVTLACKGLLIEEQRTNLTLNSDIATASTGTAVTADSSLAPDNTMSMDLVYETATSGEHYAGDRNLSATVGAAYCFSVFVKDGPSANRNYYHRIALAATTAFLFNPRTKEVSGVVTTGGYLGHGVINYSDGVSRVWISYTAQSTTNAVNRSQLWDPALGAIYTGDGTSGLYIWGAQLETGAFPTSYIPTTTAAVTRAADVAVIQGANFSNWYNQSEGTLYAELRPNNFEQVGGDQGVFTVDDGNFARGYAVAARTNVIRFIRRDASNSIGTSISYTGSTAKAATTLYSFSAQRAVNGGTVNVDPTVLSLNPMTTLRIGFNNIVGITALNYLNGHIARIAYYPRRLSNSQLQTITG